jgi:hypothetical protein
MYVKNKSPTRNRGSHGLDLRQHGSELPMCLMFTDKIEAFFLSHEVLSATLKMLLEILPPLESHAQKVFH